MPGRRRRGQDRAAVPGVMEFLLSPVPAPLSPREFHLRGPGCSSRRCWRHWDKQGELSGKSQEIGKGLELPGWVCLVFLPSFRPFPTFPAGRRYPQPTLPPSSSFVG